MIPVKGYAAQSPTTDLAPWNFERREVGPHDVQFDIQFCGVCHSDLHQIKNDWFPGIFPMVPGHEIVGRVVARSNRQSEGDQDSKRGEPRASFDNRYNNTCQHIFSF